MRKLILVFLIIPILTYGQFDVTQMWKSYLRAADTLYSQMEYQAAEDALKLALASATSQWGEVSMPTAQCLQRLSMFYQLQERWTDVIVVYKRMIPLMEKLDVAPGTIASYQALLDSAEGKVAEVKIE